VMHVGVFGQTVLHGPTSRLPHEISEKKDAHGVPAVMR